MAENKLLMYAHAGSGNHGCEAIVRSVCQILGNENENSVTLLSNDVSEDRQYGLDSVCRLVQERKIEQHFLTHAWYYAQRRLTGNGENFLRYRYADAQPFKAYGTAVSIGGDNYCYDMMIDDLEKAHRLFRGQGLRTVLLGCSIEPELINNRPDIMEDMKLYDRIIARESITFNALTAAGLKNTVLCPDPAFALKMRETELPEGFRLCENGGTIGINVSPMVQECGGDGHSGIVMHSYEKLIEYILANTEMSIALIPHVVWDRNDDRKPLSILYDKYRSTGRVIQVPDHNCMEMKYMISKCRMFIGARTHATIAAYSTGVPTLVLGYSVKSRGIAGDLFGTDEHYVIPVQDIKTDEELTEGFMWLSAHEGQIRERLNTVMPGYVGKTDMIKGYLDET